MRVRACIPCNIECRLMGKLLDGAMMEDIVDVDVDVAKRFCRTLELQCKCVCFNWPLMGNPLTS